MWSIQRSPDTPARAGCVHDREFRALQGAAFAISASFMVVFPLLPDLQERSGIATADLGLIATAGFLAALVAQIFIAPHADRGRERQVIAASVILIALSTLAFAVGDSIAWFVVGRIGAGLAYGSFTPAAIGILIRRYPDAPGQRIGRLQAVELAGMAVGPVLAVIGKVHVGVVPTLMLAAAATIVFAGPVMFGRVDAAEQAVDTHALIEHPRLIDGLGLLRHRSVIAAALVTTAYFIPIGAYDAIFPRFLADIGSSDVMIGVTLVAFALPSMLLARWAGRQVDRLGAFRAASCGGAANIAVVMLYGLVRMPVVIAVIGLFESGGQTIVGAAAAAAMGWAVPGRRAATAQGVGEAVATVAGAVMAALSAPLYAAGGPMALFFTTALLTALALRTGVVLARTASPAEDRLPPVSATVPPRERRLEPALVG
jgi:predicted MFS family arabinose efflux permease